MPISDEILAALRREVHETKLEVNAIKRAVIGDGDTLRPPLMERVGALEKCEATRQRTLRTVSHTLALLTVAIMTLAAKTLRDVIWGHAK